MGVLRWLIRWRLGPARYERLVRLTVFLGVCGRGIPGTITPEQARVRDAELAFGLARQRVREATIDQTVEEGEEEEAAAVYTALETREGVYERLADLRAEEDALYAAVRAPILAYARRVSPLHMGLLTQLFTLAPKRPAARRQLTALCLAWDPRA